MQLAIFDIDGTLTDSHGYDAYFFAALARFAGVSAEGLHLSGWTHVTDEGIAYEFLAGHGVMASDADIEAIKAEYVDALRKNMRRVAPMPGAPEVLAHLRADPAWELAIATGNWDMAGFLKLEAGGIEADGIPIVGCDRRVERTALMQHALDLSQTRHGPFDRAVYVGDAAWDVEAARALGWNFLGLNANRRKLLDLGATHVLADYRDLDATLEALHAAGVPG